jgi:hypothetical protein
VLFFESRTDPVDGEGRPQYEDPVDIEPLAGVRHVEAVRSGEVITAASQTPNFTIPFLPRDRCTGL